MSQEPEATGPGIVVLSSTLQVLHMNRRALALLNQLQHTGQSAGVERALTAPLHQHCHDIIETLQARLGSNNWERFQQNRMIGGSTNTILLKGVGPLTRGACPILELCCCSLRTIKRRCRKSAEGIPWMRSPRAAPSGQTCPDNRHVAGC